MKRRQPTLDALLSLYQRSFLPSACMVHPVPCLSARENLRSTEKTPKGSRDRPEFTVLAFQFRMELKAKLIES